MLEMRKAEAALKDICRDAIMAMFEEEAAGITTPPRRPSAEEVNAHRFHCQRIMLPLPCPQADPDWMAGGDETHHDKATLRQH